MQAGEIARELVFRIERFLRARVENYQHNHVIKGVITLHDFLLSISGIPKIVNKKNTKKMSKKIKKWPMSTQNMAKNKKQIIKKIKNTKIKIKCVVGPTFSIFSV